MITVRGDSGPNDESCVNFMSLGHSNILAKRGYYVLVSTAVSPSLIPKTSI